MPKMVDYLADQVVPIKSLSILNEYSDILKNLHVYRIHFDDQFFSILETNVQALNKEKYKADFATESAANGENMEARTELDDYFK